MRIVIDMQEVQTESHLRGNGRHALGFAQEIVRHRGEHEVILTLSGLFPKTIEPIRAAFDSLLPQENIWVWHAPSPASEEPFDNDARKAITTLIRESFLADLRPDLDVINIGRLFENCVEEALRIESDGGKPNDPSEPDLGAGARAAWQMLKRRISSARNAVVVPSHRPRLAYISPLPPLASGISDYSVELLPGLARYYRVEVVVEQEQVTDAWVRANCPIHDVTWFREHAHEFDRVLYHFGNSPFHGHMFNLLHDHPGVVVLHDFFLSGIVAHRDVTGESPHGWARDLLASHGWQAVRARFQTRDSAEVLWAYPCNLQVLQNALGVIVHSGYSCQLAREWYGEHSADDWQQIPLIRTPPAGTVNRARARKVLGVAKNAFVVCSFGSLGPTKLNHRLLDAWLASPLAKDPRCYLVFVGQNDEGDYGVNLNRTVNQSACGDRIKITGWASGDSFRQWLMAADMGVQLRTLSRGETSAAVLDCMNYGLATIANANGSMVELDQDAVWMLPDAFDNSQLVDALTVLWTDKQLRMGLGRRAREVIALRHAPRRCAAMYADAIEGYYQQAAVGLPGLLAAIAAQDPALPPSECLSLSACIAENMPPRPRRRQLLVDVSALAETDLRTGIQRVVRAILVHWLLNPPSDWQIEPVYGMADAYGYRYARRFTSRFLGVSEDWAVDEVVEAYPGDMFFALDFHCGQVVRQTGILGGWRRRGVGIQFLVYDLLPVLKPEMFPGHAEEWHRRWLEIVTQFDGAVCISHAVADELQAWCQTFGPKRERPFSVQWFHLGADPENSAPSTGMPDDASQVMATLRTRPSFLSVGTIEPRKGQAQTLSAFELLWMQGVDVNLVFVGKQGWMVEGLVERLRNHAELGKRLFWLEGISDEYLEKAYAASTCLIAASEGEGFGLPLIEAAQHKLPIIARDIPVFREVAGEHAFYFKNAEDPQVITQCITQWLELNDRGQAPQSVAMPWLTWKESAEHLSRAIGLLAAESENSEVTKAGKHETVEI